jgi:DNA-binding PadR family transcriptional regulator
MDREQLILACLGAAEGSEYRPVQIQKLVFLIQEKADWGTETKPFHFQAYDYGAFDASVYNTLASLAVRGLIEIDGQQFGRTRTYRLTNQGRDQADAALRQSPFADYLVTLSRWVRNQSFNSLVSAVYRDFPWTKENSVFRS